MAIEIESGIPMPRSEVGRPLGELMSAICSLQVGQSFVVERKWKHSHFHAYAKRAGIKVVTRRIDGDKFRVWRAE